MAVRERRRARCEHDRRAVRVPLEVAPRRLATAPTESRRLRRTADAPGGPTVQAQRTPHQTGTGLLPAVWICRCAEPDRQAHGERVQRAARGPDRTHLDIG